MSVCLSPSLAERGRVGVGATVAKIPSAPLPASPRSLREQGEGQCTRSHYVGTYDFPFNIADKS